MKRLLLVVFILFVVTPVFGRMGWTKEQVEERYGERRNTIEVASKVTGHIYLTSHPKTKVVVMVTVIYNRQNRVAGIIYQLTGRLKHWEERDIEAFKRLNSKKDWSEEGLDVETVYARSGNIVMSHPRFLPSILFFLEESLMNYLDKELREKQQTEMEESF